MKWLIRVLSTQMRELNTSLALIYNNSQTALFINIPDGLQRLVPYAKIKLSNVDKVFLNSIKQECFAGLPGFYHTTNESNTENKDFKLEIYGPKSLSKNMNSFTIAYGGPNGRWNVHELIQQEKLLKEKFEDSKKEEKKGIRKVPIYEYSVEMENLVKIIPIIMNDGKNSEISYILQPTESKRPFKGQKAKELGLTPKEIKELIKGNSIKLPDGKIITPEEMYEKPIVSGAAIILYAKNENHISNIIKNTELAEYYLGKSDSKNVSLIYHNTSSEVLLNPVYLDFLQKFGTKLLHIIDCKELNNDENPRIFSYYFTKLLNAINSRIFPNIPSAKMHTCDEKLKDKILSEFLKRGLNAQIALMGYDYAISENEAKISSNSVYEHSRKEALLDSAEEVKENISKNPKLNEIHEYCEKVKPEKNFKNEPFITFLGTASQKPSKRRSLSSIYLNIPGKYEEKINDPRINPVHFAKSYGVLVDCGEGAYGQLLDHFHNPEIISQILSNLSVIFISHHHGDHSFGLGSILKACEENLLKFYKISDKEKVEKEHKLYIILPSNMLKYARKTIKQECPYFSSRIRLLTSFSLNPMKKFFYTGCEHGFAPRILEEDAENLVNKIYKQTDITVREFGAFLNLHMNIKTAYTIETDHCIESHGLCLQGPDWKIIYSGDTVPCETIENFSYKTDLLIHECTFVDDAPRACDDVKHTSLSEAVKVVKKIKPWRTVLTHFSNKDRRICKLSPDAINENIFAAFDHTHFKLSDLEWMHKLVPLLESVIDNEKKSLPNKLI